MMFRLRDVSYRYGTSGGVEIDTLDIAPRGITAVIGPSGSGKTTLLSLLAGFIPATVGTGGQFMFGERLAGTGCFENGEAGFVFQSAMLLGAASGSVNMLAGHAVSQRRSTAPGERATPIDRRELSRLVANLGLSGDDGLLLFKRARQLSGGEAQRVAVLRALLGDPLVILCDEPTSSLDAYNAEQVMNALKAWAKQRDRPVVWVTHSLEQAAEHAEHFVFLRDGRILEPSDEDREALLSEGSAERLAALRRVTAIESCMPQIVAPGPCGDVGDPLRAPAHVFRRWVAQALSSDGFAAAGIEQRNRLALASPDHLDALGSLVPPERGAGGTGARLWARLRTYPHLGLSAVLTILMVQVFTAFAIYFVALLYYERQLQDPALWRLTFSVDYLSEENRRTGVVPPPLTYETIGDSEIAGSSPGDDGSLRGTISSVLGVPRQAVDVVGRRFLETQIRIEPSEKCSEWRSVSTLVLAPRDPILGLAEFRAAPAGNRAMAVSLGAAADRGDLAPIVADEWLDAEIREHCGPFPPDGSVLVEWAPSEQLRPAARTLQLANSAVTRMPPIHPYSARVIVFEPDFQAALQQSVAVSGARPFDQASVYLPRVADGFQMAEDVLKEKGYSLTDDSRAAVLALQQIAGVVTLVPGMFVMMNLVAMSVITWGVIANQLALNRRVLTLFIAYDFRLVDIALVIARHLLPAMAGALLVSALAAWLGWLLLKGYMPGGLGSLAPEFASAFVFTSAGCLLAFAAAVIGAPLFWGHRTALRLTENLRE